MTGTDGDWIAAAEGVLRRSPGRRALDELEWDAVGDLRDDDTRVGFACLFRAQGRVLGSTPALGVLVANRLLGSATTETSTTSVTRVRAAGDEIQAVALAGFDEAARVVVEVVGADGSTQVRTTDRSAWTVVAGGPGAFDPLIARSVRLPTSALGPAGSTGSTSERVDRCRSLARLAIAHETLGACDHLMAVAVAYALERRQFGAPIGSFQAVAHLLAEAEVQRRALHDACETAMARSDADGPGSRETVLLKGLAGRTGRTVAQHTLQVLGGIGFTWEHEHHRYARRVLTLDALFGSVEEMRAQAVRDRDGSGILRTAVA